jgi:hypothetical protein
MTLSLFAALIAFGGIGFAPASADRCGGLANAVRALRRRR